MVGIGGVPTRNWRIGSYFPLRKSTHNPSAINFAARTFLRRTLLALISTVCRTDPALREVMEERIAANQAKGPRAAAETVAKTLFSEPLREAEPEFLEKFYAWRVASPQDPIFDSMRATFALDICHALPRFRMPCMVVAGAADAADAADATPENVARLADDIPGATFQNNRR